MPATEVARRAGHGVAVLLKIYAHCIDGQADAANQRITDASAPRTPGALMAGVAVHETVTLAGRAERARIQVNRRHRLRR